jgi:AcrR family transcriptional regulator
MSQGTVAETGDGTGGLRERKKRATRRALHDAALRMAWERGLENLTVEEISAAADVSPRTFFNYFPAKEQAVIGDDFFPADEEKITALVRDAGSVLDGLRDVALAIAADTVTRREQVLMRWQLMERYPALITRMFARLEEFGTVLASAVAARTGASPDDTYPKLMAAVTATAIRVAVRQWTAGHGDLPLEHYLSETFGLLQGEFPPGRAAGPPAFPRKL